MNPHSSDEIIPVVEQRLLLPGYYDWEEFHNMGKLRAKLPGLRLTYLDRYVEFMTLGEEHERLKTILGFLLELYMCEMGINFIPLGSATRRSQNKGTSFEPDESYYLGEKKKNPDLAIEINITSSSIDKLEKYKRFNIIELWFWEYNQLSLYRLRDNNYEQITRSTLLPDLDTDLLARCVLMPSILEARIEFIKGISYSLEMQTLSP